MSPLSKKGRYVYCADCGCRLEMNGVCKICGHTDTPPLAGMVPDVIGMTLEAGTALITGPEAQLTLGTITTENTDTVVADLIIDTNPPAGTQLEIGTCVDIVISLGPAE